MVKKKPHIIDNGIGTIGVKKEIKLERGWKSRGRENSDVITIFKNITGEVEIFGKVLYEKNIIEPIICELPDGFEPEDDLEFTIMSAGENEEIIVSAIVVISKKIVLKKWKNTNFDLNIRYRACK